MIKIENNDILEAVYEVKVFAEAINLTRDIITFDRAKELIKARDALSYKAWMMIVQEYPQIRDDTISGQTWQFTSNVFGEVFLRKIGE